MCEWEEVMHKYEDATEDSTPQLTSVGTRTELEVERDGYLLVRVLRSD